MLRTLYTVNGILYTQLCKLYTDYTLDKTSISARMWQSMGYLDEDNPEQILNVLNIKKRSWQPPLSKGVKLNKEFSP